MTLPIAPKAATRPHAFTHHGITIEDPWAWLKDPAYPNVDDEDVLAYLRAENAYFDAAMAPHETLVDTIFEEMKGRLKQDDSSVPQKEGDYLYWWAYETGGQYPRWWRRPIGGGADELILDEPMEAEGKEYFRLGALTVSPDGKLLAWAADESGAERFTLRIRDLATGADIETVSTVINGGVAWSAGSDAILYTEVNDNWRSYRALLHTLGDDPAKDAQLYEEADEGFRVAVGNTHDRAWLMIATGDNQTSEVRIIPATDPTAEPLLVSPRQVKRQYSVESAHGSLWILTNDDHVNFRIVRADPRAPAAWEEVVAGSDDTYLTGIAAFDRHLMIAARIGGLDQIILRGWDGSERRVIFPEASYSAGASHNPEFAPDAYRLTYSSMVTPLTVFDCDPDSLALTPGAGNPVGLRPLEICDRAPQDHRARRHRRCRCRSSIPGTFRATDRASSISMPMAPMATRSRRASRPAGCRSSIAAWPSPSRISAAATISASNGISTASSRSGPTRSTISSMSRRG
jgi:oligopeptidase B